MKTPFKDSELKEIVERKISQSVGVYDSRISKERENVLKYYNRQSPKPNTPRSASYISTTVYDAVETAKAQLLDAFANGRDIIAFDALHAADVEPARIASAYTNWVVSEQNDLQHIMQTVIDDGLKARNGIVKVYWDDDKTFDDREFDGLDEASVMALSQSDEVTDLEGDIDPLTGLYSGVLTKVSDASQVRIDCVAPEDFGIEPEAKCLEGFFHYHRTLKTRAQIKAMGFDVKKIRDKKPDGDTTTAQDLEVVARFDAVSSGYRPGEDADENGKFWLYECYHNLEADGRRALYKIVRVAGEILDVEEVDRSPFKAFTPLPVAHSFWGNNFAELSIPTQNATTALTRSILDHAAITSNPRYMVVQGGLTNPKELLDNRLGGLVNVKSPDSVVPMPQAQLTQYAFPTIELLKSNNESTTGISSITTGLNKDVISNQNSQAMISDIVDRSMLRANMVARNFAYGFLVPLFTEVYRLVIENESRKSIQQVSGNWIEIDPASWIARKNAKLVLHLTTSEDQAKAGKLSNLLQMAASDPALNSMVPADKRYNIGVEMLTLLGFKNTEKYIMDPANIPPAQPDPMVVAQMEIAKMQAEAGMMVAQANVLKAQTDQSHKQHAEAMAEMKAQVDAMRVQMDLMRKQLETENRIAIAQRETDLLEHQAAVDSANVRGIISP